MTLDETIKKEIIEVTFAEMEKYPAYLPYDFVDYITRKYSYPAKGIDVYDCIHDWYNTNYQEVEDVQARKYLSFRDFTHSLVT